MRGLQNGEGQREGREGDKISANEEKDQNRERGRKGVR